MYSHKIHPSWLIIAISIASILAVIIVQILGLSGNSQSAEFLKQFRGKTITVSGTVLKDPIEADGKISFTLTDLNLENTSLNGKLYVTFSSFSTKATAEDLLKTSEIPHRSDKLTLNGELKDGFGTFIASMKNPKILEIQKPGDFFLNLRDTFAEQIKNHVGDESGLELGYLLGMKTAIDPDFEEALRIVGLTHIIVASGTHLGILVGFSRKIFGKISRFAGFLGATLLIIIFVGITGLTPSMTRAAFVSLLSLIAWYFGRDADPWRILLYSATITLLIDPNNLLDLAWQLSFGSFAGLMLLSPIFIKFFYGSREPGFLGSSLITSLSTILCCAPILIYNFGSISLISILANLLILPTIPAVMGLGVITGLLGLLGLAPLATASGFLVSLILKYHIFIVNFLSSQTAFVIEIEEGQPLIFLLYLIPLTIIVLYSVRVAQKRKLWYNQESRAASSVG